MADIMADIVETHAEQVIRKVAAQPNSRQASVAEALLNEGTDEVVPDHAQERVPHIVLISFRALRASVGGAVSNHISVQFLCGEDHLASKMLVKRLGFEEHEAVVRGLVS